MHEVLETLLSNAAVAVFLALLAVTANGLRARPALVHALWVLVLLKLVTPPIFRVPIALPLSAPPGATASVSPRFLPLPPSSRVPDTLVAPFAAAASPETPTPAQNGRSRPQIPWLQILLGLWITGTAVTLGATGRDLRRMRKILRRANPASADLQHQVDALARRMGIRRAPAVSLIRAKLSPMLWADFGPPRLLLPEGLLARLEPQARTSLLVHELAHMRRRDHWVRYLEVLVRNAYWWNPLVWWACHQLRIAEEECCDGWVLWALPRAGRSYANALLETVDFLNGSPTALPAAASGVGRVQNLKRRLTMIMQGNTRKSLTRRGRLAVLSLAALALPLIPVHGQNRDHLEQALHEHHTRLQNLHEHLQELTRHSEQVHRSGDEHAIHRVQDRLHDVHALVTHEEDILAQLQDELHATLQAAHGPQDPVPTATLDALHKAIDALRSRDQFEEAEILADLADNLSRDLDRNLVARQRDQSVVELERALADERDRRTALERQHVEMEAERHAAEMEARIAEELHQDRIQAEQHAVEMQRHQADMEDAARARQNALEQHLLQNQPQQGGDRTDEMRRLEARVEELAAMVRRLIEITEKQQAEARSRTIR